MIPQTFSDAFASVKKLVDIFHHNEAFYTNLAYNEADARKDFIDKFWIALGWDVNHETQTNPYQQEVKVERGVATSEWRKRADYAFLAPNFRDVRFFVEAKKPQAGLDNPLFYFQTIRYGWNSHVPISVLSDFEELRVLDCRYKPDITTALGRAVLKYHYTDYADEAKFRTIYYLFSREAVLKGSLEEYAKGLPKLSRKRAARGVVRDDHQNIDEAFLKELDEYREELARAFKRKNPELGSEELTEVTQRTLDRLVFMRFLEDKLIESEPLIENLHQPGKAWQNFIASSRRLDKIYNGIIFKEHSLLDSPDFEVDERTFDKISQSLSHQQSPYDFNAIPIHILGSIYERFLGKVIVATAKQARVEEKPEVRKAGGVYYTPEYIVRYIVDNTVGKLIEGKTPEQIRQMKFADIACGSGSFLLGVYDKLLRYHTAYYNRTKKNQNEGRRAGCLTTDTGALRLSLLQKRTILLNNIFGVDIDPQAVEVAQLSLYLKLLEEETIASAHQQLSLRQALLPSLSENIICGNSLISRDPQENKLFATADERELNPLNFDVAFKKVMETGGFDAIVGNPPYRRELDYKHLMDQIAATAWAKQYRRPRMDLWYYFVHKALELLKTGGTLSYIVNAYWTAGTGSEKLIASLRDENHLDEIFFLGSLKVFEGVSGQHLIFRASKMPSHEATLVKLPEIQKEKTAETFVSGGSVLNVFSKTATQLFRAKKLDLQPPSEEFLVKAESWPPLRNYGLIRQGIAENPASINRKTNIKYGSKWVVGEGVFTLTPAELSALQVPKAERELLRPYYDLSDVGRYYLSAVPSLTLIYSTRKTCKDINDYPTLRQHLMRFRPIMNERRETLSGANEWWHLHWPRNEELWKANKILSVQMAERPAFVPALMPVYVPFSINVFVPAPNTREHLFFITAILNSKLIWKWYEHNAKRRGVGLEINGNVLERTPIRKIDFSNADEVEIHDHLVELVTQIMDATQQLNTARTERDKNFYRSKRATLDRQIDDLVYELYNLTAQEIATIERAP